ncbi:MAG TPA: adenylate/guanylate cyclase domain-containing protein [Longimicrobiales bacterium]|nr:adenylate/guanylate cyclase domain-containing protein [Longimicrobiales bacterium]
MNCPRCEQPAPADAAFCPKCGAKLTRACGQCGVANAPDDNFCRKCGARLDVASAPPATRFATPQSYTPQHLADRILTSKTALEGERKQVTVLFADLKGSMELLADRDPEEARKILDPVLERMMDAVHHYEGTVNQVMGDGIMALFGAPIAHEDHAVRACYAALRMQELVKRYAEDARLAHGINVQIRVGLNSGEVVVRAIGSDLHMDYTAVGQTTHLAARMEQFASPGSILLTPSTLELVEGFVAVKPLGPVPVKGLASAVEVYEVTGAGPARTRLQAVARRGLTRFVGRDAELEQLRRAQGLAGTGHGQLATVVGEAGVGKSRLVRELTHRHPPAEWLVLEAGASSYGKATSYLPVSALLRSYFKLGERDRDEDIRARISARLSALGESPWPAAPALEALLGVPVENAPWQELEPRQRRQHTLDVVRRLILRESQIQPLLLVLEDLHWIDAETQAWLDGLVDALPAARLLLLVTYRPEYQHAWGNRTYYTQLRVDPLPHEGAEDLLQALLGADAELASLRRLLIERTEGNPFFLEESVRTLVETQALVGERGAHRLAQALDRVQVPATVQAILASRIDRLPLAEKQLLQSAAVIGKDVPFILLHAIADEAEEGLRRQLAHLQSAEFLYETRLLPDSEYTFKHALTQEVAYSGLLTDRRRAVHARIVEEIERLQGDRLVEQVERLAHHALRAERWDKALVFCRQAGAKAMGRWALRDAGTHLERALTATRHLPETRDAIEQAIDVRLELRHAIHPLGEVERGMEHVREAESLAERLGDTARSGMISLLLGNSLWMLGHSDRAQEPLDRALAIAESTDNGVLRLRARALLGSLHHDRGDYRQAAATLREVLSALEATGASSIASGVSPVVAFVTTYLAWSLAELGEFAEATRRTEESLRLAEALENPFHLIMACMGVGMVHLRQGNAPAAMPALERGLQVCHTFGLTALMFHGIAASLGAAYALANQPAEAIPLLRKVADQAASMKLVSDHLLGAIPLGEVSLSTGRIEDAAQLGRHALDLARQHKQHGHEVNAHRLLGEVAARRDPTDVQAAEAHYRGAIELAHELGMRPLIARSHQGLGTLYRRTGKREQAQEHLRTATTLYREMDMRFWLEQADVGLRQP